MPYEKEHACRLKNPDDFKDDSFRRTKRKHNGKEYSVISGKLKGEDSMTEQAYRYDKEKWTASEAKSHCKDHDGSFEAAKDSKQKVPEMERRFFSCEDIEIRLDDGKEPKLSGYAAKYNIFADVLWFREKIKPGAFDDALKKDDVRCLKNHDPNLILGRKSSGTLRLDTNTVGLRFDVDVPNTTTGNDTLEEVRRKDISGCSFSFIVAEEDIKTFDDGRPMERTIVKIGKLFDVGPVTWPAYKETTVVSRSLDIFKKQNQAEGDQGPEERKEKTEEEAQEQRERRLHIEKGYREACCIHKRVTDQINLIDKD